MRNQNSTMENIEIIYPHPIKPLADGEHQNSQDIVKKLNEVIVMLNRLRSAL